MSGNWEPKKKWHRLHGDKKSTTGGKWHMETMHGSDGKYKVKLVEDSNTLEYDEEPTYETIVRDVKAAYGK